MDGWDTRHLHHQSKVGYKDFELYKGRKFKNPREIDPATGQPCIMWRYRELKDSHIIYHGEPYISNTLRDFIGWEPDNKTGEVVIHCKNMHEIRVFNEHELTGLHKEDMLNLYNSPLRTVEDIGCQNKDRIV